MPGIEELSAVDKIFKWGNFADRRCVLRFICQFWFGHLLYLTPSNHAKYLAKLVNVKLGQELMVAAPYLLNHLPEPIGLIPFDHNSFLQHGVLIDYQYLGVDFPEKQLQEVSCPALISLFYNLLPVQLLLHLNFGFFYFFLHLLPLKLRVSQR